MNNNDNNNTQNLKLNIDINALPTVHCKECGNDVFIKAFKLKFVSSVISPSGKDDALFVHTVICANCSAEHTEEDFKNQLDQANKKKSQPIFVVGTENDNKMLAGPTKYLGTMKDFVPDTDIEEEVYIFKCHNDSYTPIYHWNKKGKYWERIKG
jgi:hypothetical protein